MRTSRACAAFDEIARRVLVLRGTEKAAKYLAAPSAIAIERAFYARNPEKMYRLVRDAVENAEYDALRDAS